MAEAAEMPAWDQAQAQMTWQVLAVVVVLCLTMASLVVSAQSVDATWPTKHFHNRQKSYIIQFSPFA